MTRMVHELPRYSLNKRKGKNNKQSFIKRCCSIRSVLLLLTGSSVGYMFTAWNLFGADVSAEKTPWSQHDKPINVGIDPVNVVVNSSTGGSHQEENDDEKHQDAADMASAEADKVPAEEYRKQLSISQKEEISLFQEDKKSRSTSVLEQQEFLSSQSIPTATTPYVMETKKLSDSERKKIMITGGAGFVGSHLVDKLMQEGHEVIVIDNFFTGQKKNIEHWLHHPNFR